MPNVLHSFREKEINDVVETGRYSTKVPGKAYFNKKNSQF